MTGSPLLAGRQRMLYREAFIFGLGIAAAIFLPFIISDNGYFFYYGDYNAQQIPFYHLAHDAVRAGETAWSWGTDLGANFIGSYSFYLLGSPFFMITLLFPPSFVPYLIAPLLILKFALASFTSYLYLSRHVSDQKNALIGALLYAFSGFATYNIFYNHFHEMIVFFPLLLLGIDMIMEADAGKEKYGFFAVTVALNCFANYFFFVGEVVFAVLYWVVRSLCRSWTVTPKKTAIIAVESIIGLGLSCILLIPSLLAIMGNSRTGSLYSGWNLLLYSNEQVFPYIIQSMFFLPELPARPVFFPDANVQWSSVSLYLPLFGMTGVLTYCIRNKKSWITRLLAVSLVMALVPCLNSLFILMRDSYYARWFYMPLLIMALATAKALDSCNMREWLKGTGISAAVTALFAVLIGLLPTSLDGDGTWSDFGLYSREFDEFAPRFWMYVFIAAAGLMIVLSLTRFRFSGHKKYFRRTLAVLMAFCIVTGIYYVAIGRSYGDDPETYIIPKEIEAEEWMLPDDHFYRVDTVDALDNIAMYWDMSCINCFHSIVPASIMEFYESIGITRDVASRPDPSRYVLRALTSTEFVLVDNNKTDYDLHEIGYIHLGIQNGFGVWKNSNYIPMGFSYDSYMTESEYYDIEDETVREQLLVRTLVVEDEYGEAAGRIYPHYEYDADEELTYEGFTEACAERRSESCSSFTYNDESFTAEYSAEGDELVFFSVPYDSGWSAEVNGEPAGIIKAGVGFMAVAVEAGDNTISFSYTTPGLYAGMAVTAVSAVAFASYLVVMLVKRKRGR